MEFTPHGVCSKNIHLEVDEAGRIHNVEFTGGCNGNLQGIGRLVEGMDIHEAISRIEGHRTACGGHGCRGSYQAAGRHNVRIQEHILPGSAFTCFKRIFKQ